MSAPAFVRIEVRARDADVAERLLAEAVAAGAVGGEEHEDGGRGIRLVLYVETGCADAVRSALLASRVDAGEAEVGAPEAVVERDWSEAWREGLEATWVSPRLVVRPPWLPSAARPGRVEVVIEPGQAFGTGGHESTRLALELLDAALAGRDEAAPAPSVLDAGTGSGVLAIAAVRRGAARAVGFDLDPVAVAAAAGNVRANRVADRVRLYSGPLAALGPGRFGIVVANLLRRELEPLLPDLAARVAPGGCLLLSGLLAEEACAVKTALARAGLEPEVERTRSDPRGERWSGLQARARS